MPYMNYLSGTVNTIRQGLRLDRPLAVLILLLTAMNIPYWDAHFMVGHDTKNTYLLFHYLYNHFVWYAELPQWLPYGEYGYSSMFFQLSGLSPCSYLVGLLGWLLRVDDSLILFKLSAFGDQLIMLLGLHLLSRLLYRNRATSFVVCLLGIGCIVWTWQIFWGLRFFYLLPLALYFFFRFLEERISWAFWLGILTLLFQLVGGLPYWIPIYAYLFLVMTIIMLPGNWRAYGALLRPGARDAFLIVIVAGTAVSIGYILQTCLDGLHNYSPGRATGEMYADLKTFMTYNTYTIWEYLDTFFEGTIPHIISIEKESNDLSPYIGLLPLGAIAFFFPAIRDSRFNSIVGGLLAILLLAGSGMTSWLHYWLMPGMNTFRHLVLLLEIAKILLLLSAGYGIDLLFSKLMNGRWLRTHFRPFIYFILMAVLMLIFDMTVSHMAYDKASWASNMHFVDILPHGGEWIVVRLVSWGIFLTVALAYARLSLLKKHPSGRIIPALLIVMCLIDIGTFQCYLWQNRTSGKFAGRLELKPLNFSATRVHNSPDKTPADFAIITSSPAGTFHGYYANILQYDTCTPVGQVNLVSRGIHELVTARGSNPLHDQMWGTFLPFHDPELLKVLGCEEPKIRFVSQASFGATDQQITNLLRHSQILASSVVLRGPFGQEAGVPTEPGSSPMSYRTVFFNANRLDLDVTIKQGSYGWLVFADAFNPHWKAYINGAEKPVLEAYGAFKAVSLNGGSSKISFRYENTNQQVAMGILILFGVLAAAGCVTILLIQVLYEARDNKP